MADSVAFDVQGPDYRALASQAYDVLADYLGADPSEGGWVFEVDASPIVRSADGTIELWSGHVCARALPGTDRIEE